MEMHHSQDGNIKDLEFLHSQLQECFIALQSETVPDLKEFLVVHVIHNIFMLVTKSIQVQHPNRILMLLLPQLMNIEGTIRKNFLLLNKALNGKIEKTVLFKLYQKRLDSTVEYARLMKRTRNKKEFEQVCQSLHHMCLGIIQAYPRKSSSSKIYSI